jgi:hypothetical protein
MFENENIHYFTATYTGSIYQCMVSNKLMHHGAVGMLTFLPAPTLVHPSFYFTPDLHTSPVSIPDATIITQNTQGQS